MYSKYWICEHEDGIEGFESAEPVNAEYVRRYFKAEGLKVQSVYPVTKWELYTSEVDIW